MDMVRQALPMVMSFLKMAMVICIPMVLVIGTYQLKVAMTMTVVFFAMMFVDFWFQLARYIDSTILMPSMVRDHHIFHSTQSWG